MHTINGFSYSNLNGLVMKQGERVRWYQVGMGSRNDIHTPHWHGQTSISNGHRVDTVQLLPSSTLVADMILTFTFLVLESPTLSN